MSKKAKILLVGAILGGLFGVALAWAVSDTIDDEGQIQMKLKPTDYFQLGISLLNLARQFGSYLGRA